MSVKRVYTFDQNDLTEFANQVKECLAAAMYDDGILESKEVLNLQFAVVVTERNWLGKTISKAMGHSDKDNSIITILKTIPNKVVDSDHKESGEDKR